jgi:MFS family permease
VASLIASNFIMRWGYRWPMILGTFIIAVSFLLLGLEPNSVTILGKGLNNLTLMAIIMLFMGLGSGVTSPAANNACIELMPQRVATITAVRSMFRQAGGAVSLTIATLVLHLSGNMARGFLIVFLSIALALLASISVIFAMPGSPNSNVFSKEATSR